MFTKGLQEGFKELYGQDIPGAKFKIGQVVTFTKKFCEGSFFGAGEEAFVGAVLGVNFTEDTYEYLIEGAPVLAWEQELTDG